MINKILGSAALCGSLFLVACGGGGGGSDPEPGSEPQQQATIVGKSVAGPLDPVQTQISQSALTPLANSLAGTPLEAVVQCGGALVNQDVLDLADTVLASLQTTAASPGASNPEALAGSLRLIVTDLTQLLQGLAGNAVSCATDTLSLAQLEAVLHALDGTPLAPLAAQLQPVLANIIATIGTGAPGSTTGAPSLANVSALVTQLNTALQTALTQLPAGTLAAPVVGGVLATLSASLDDAQTLIAAVLANNTAGASTALQSLVKNTLDNVLTLIVPLQNLQAQGGNAALTNNILSGSTQLSGLLGGSVGRMPQAGFPTQLTGVLTTLFSSFDTLLPNILGPISEALGGAGSGTGTGTGPLAGTPLAGVLATISTTLTGLLGSLGGGLGGGGIGGIGGGSAGTACAFANFPLLSGLCVLPIP